MGAWASRGLIKPRVSRGRWAPASRPPGLPVPAAFAPQEPEPQGRRASWGRIDGRRRPRGEGSEPPPPPPLPAARLPPAPGDVPCARGGPSAGSGWKVGMRLTQPGATSAGAAARSQAPRGGGEAEEGPGRVARAVSPHSPAPRRPGCGGRAPGGGPARAPRARALSPPLHPRSAPGLGHGAGALLPPDTVFTAVATSPAAREVTF